MMASLTFTALPSTAALATRQQRSARKARGVQRCYAQAEGEEKKLTFESNKRAALGFTESDSAGQTNIFAVEPKLYVAGSSSDQTAADAGSTVGAAAIAGTVAVGTVIAGLLLVQSSSVVDLGPTGDFKSLSEYKADFSAELKDVPAAAPAPADS